MDGYFVSTVSRQGNGYVITNYVRTRGTEEHCKRAQKVRTDSQPSSFDWCSRKIFNTSPLCGGIFYLLSYSPDMNPNEHINADRKYGVGSNTPKKIKEVLKEATKTHMDMLRKTPIRIKRYFFALVIAYAADI
jgi:hypothetical protein